MELNTASAAVSFARRLEEDSAKLYEDLAGRYAEGREILLSFARENRKNIAQVERTYYEVITDAIEGCFAFDINPDEYKFETKVAEKVSYSDALCMAIEVEEKIVRFYSDAAEQSKSLMADFPRVFAVIAKKRQNRKPQLRSILERED